MKYDFDRETDRRNTWSVKHDLKEKYKKPADCIPLWVADMDFCSPDCVKQALSETIEHGIFGYSQADDRYYETVLSWYERRMGWKPEKEWIVCTPGIVFALSMAVQAFSKEGDRVLIQTPVYGPFRKAIERNGRIAVENPLILKDGRYEMDLAGLEKTIETEQVTLMLLCSPHNPGGRVWDEEELRSVSEICQRHHVFVVSDEIHGDLIYPGRRQIPYASLSEDAAAHCMVCTSPSKTFNLAGLTLSNLFIPDPEARRTFNRTLARAGMDNINRMGMVACTAAYRHGEEWLEELLSYLEGNLALLRDFTKNRVPQIDLIEPNGTYLAWLDCRRLGWSDEELDHFFSHTARVWLEPGTDFGNRGSGFMRINLASSRSVIKEALDRIEKAWFRERRPDNGV